MKQYKAKHGTSGVVAYEIGAESIAVKFKSGDVYVYTNASAGAGRIRRMKRLAESGEGLATYISQSVKDAYAEKIG